MTPKKRPQSETRNYKSPKTKSATPLNKKNVKKTKANCSLLTTEITTPIEQNSTETTPEIENTETIQIDKDKDNINVTKDTSNQTTSSSLNNNQSSKISPETPQSDTSQTIAITLSTTATNDISTKVETPSTEIKSNTSSPNQPETVTKGKVKNKKKSRRNSWPALNEDTIKDVPKDNGKQTENTSYVSQAKTNTSDSLEMVESSQESFVYVAPVQNTTVGVKTGNVLETSGKDENLVRKKNIFSFFYVYKSLLIMFW